MSAPRRLYLDALPAAGGEVWLDPSAARHANVLRLTPGTDVVLFDGRGSEAAGRVVAVGPDRLRCRTERPRRVSTLPPVEITLAPGLPKAGKLDLVVRMATELGVHAIRPFVAARSVARPPPSRAQKQTERLHAIAREASRQCGRATVPQVDAPVQLDRLLHAAPEDAARFFLDPNAADTLWAATDGLHAPQAWLFVGPEGGFDPAEEAQLVRSGARAVRVGAHVLRTETAGITGVALLAARLAAQAPG